ncbi:MAG: DNA topoisomerase (ATP-hydrolyzing) subunit B [Candidatus Faecenecus gallistercoris]|nr:DNA topoisomerase (ATP-hydrolyzing) subunit B [Bacillota bacterium]MDD7102444.1 DNA topoisomerase (ATP-hydrolyzing) subunit B [Bacillota bacterium]MDY4051645.1 DNA topoisomerase (ATP-hydrolyzing) subunit B [Candidatus Faecenecus gallistercoris]
MENTELEKKIEEEESKLKAATADVEIVENEEVDAKVEGNYDSSSIQVLEGLEAVRKRPGMYIGTTSARGLHHLVWEIVDNSIDEAMAGYAHNIEVRINPDQTITVSDDGRGIPVDVHPKTGKSTVETVYTVLHAGGKFGGGGYKVSGGLHGVGASVVNALSDWLEVKVYRDGKVYSQRYQNGGHPVAPLEVIGECSENRTGTTVTFKPDPEIFKETTIFDYETLKQRLRELAFLNRGLKITLIDDREPDKKAEFLYEGGLREYVAMLNENKQPIHPTIVDVVGKENDISIEVALQYNESYSASIYSFVNNITTPEGGTHEDGVRRALTRVLNKYSLQAGLLKGNDEPLTGEDVREGITMIISCRHPNPQFEGQTKTKLGNAEVRAIADRIFSEAFERFLLENPAEAKAIVEKATTATRARIAAKRARELTRRKNVLEVSSLPGKLADCSSKDASICELFIVEGNSAGGSAIGGRDSKTQAILPLRGKILNVEKTRLDHVLGNEEIRSLITAIGTGIGDEFDIKKLRYNKIIIMTDADVDGAHIATLLLTFFYKFFRPLIEQGHIFIAQPPLYKVVIGKTARYLLDDAELNEFLATLPENTKKDISRNKGLGEMDPEELCATTMDPKYRSLLRVNIDDPIFADQTFTLLMGEEVEPRKKFIEENAVYVQNLDI